MENYLFVLLLSLFVLLVAFYVNKVKEELESTRKASLVKEEWESTRQEIKLVHVKLDSTRNAQLCHFSGSSTEDHDLQDQLLEKGEKEKELGNVNVKLGDFGKPYWRVNEKVPGYGADLTLFCFVDDCCSKAAGWIKWNPDYKTIYLDVRNSRGTASSKDKYAATTNNTGFFLVIKNLQEDDLDIRYSCSYGFKNSLDKLLHNSEVFKGSNIQLGKILKLQQDETTTTNVKDETPTTYFKDETTTTYFKEVTTKDETATDLKTHTYSTERENNSELVEIIWKGLDSSSNAFGKQCSASSSGCCRLSELGPTSAFGRGSNREMVVVAVVILVAIVTILIVKFQQRRRFASRHRRKSSEEGQDSQNQLLAKGEKDEELANENTKLGESSEEGQDAQNQLLTKGEKEEELANGNTKLGESSEEGQDSQNQLLAKGEKEEEFANGNTKLGGSSEEGQDMQNQLLTKEKK
ncbi:unnamed protein product [Mytilus coruscus]|uniref:Ig-like domain-containing protein n=1 Tax=Mytilus coruscus TaxID=42192 RepID=A0A6J8D7U7_MYTCO|nr:unnamed protein product [Mytilus coruscus]